MFLYFNQGSNSAGGAPDGSWGNRPERLLSAAVLRLDLDKLPENQWPLDAETTMDQAAINSVNVNSATLDGKYNPYWVDAPVDPVYATGVRNAYDLAWHSNGQLYTCLPMVLRVVATHQHRSMTHVARMAAFMTMTMFQGTILLLIQQMEIIPNETGCSGWIRRQRLATMDIRIRCVENLS